MTPHRMQKTYRCENHVTRGAGQGAFTCPKPIQVDVIVDGNVQQVVTILCLVDGQQLFSQFFHFVVHLDSVLFPRLSNFIGDCVKIAPLKGWS